MDRSKPASSLSFEETLSHFGVKGMHWGVRKNSGNKPSGVTVREVPGQGVKTSGGHNLGPSHDAVRAAQAQQIAKASGTHALSNQELQLLVTRMNLERQYSTLTTQSRNVNPGVKFAQELLVNIGKQQATKLAGDFASKQVAKQLAKAALTK